MNQSTFKPFKDARVRRAFNHAIDKDRIIKSLLLGINPKANGIIPPGIPGYRPGFKGLQYDPDRARALLAEAGYPGGKGFPTLTLTFREKTPDLKRTAEVIAQMLQESLGIEVSLREMEWGAFLAARHKGTLDFYHLRWAADYLDAQNFLSTMLRAGSPQNTTGYDSPEFNRLCDLADTERDPAKRAKLYQQAEDVVVNDAAWVPVYFQRDVELAKPYVKGIEDGLMGHLPHKRTHLETGRN
jgi:oligopeptide transport system substrate-binding protein